MTPDEAVPLLEAEWELDTGFFGKLRWGEFDADGGARVIATLERVERPDAGVSARFVAVTWSIPLFMEWQREQITADAIDAKTYALAANRIEALLSDLLGSP